MAEIWFGDLECDPINVDNCLKFKQEFDKLYKKYREKYPNIFNSFPEVFDIDVEKNTIELSENVCLVDWHKDEYLKPFILQGGPDSQWITWGPGPSEKNDIISAFTNELVKIVGKQGITFYFQVIMDGGYEDYSISIYPNLDNEFPKVQSDAEYNEDDGDDW